MGKGEVDGAAWNGSGVGERVGLGFGKEPLFVMAPQRTEWFPDAPAITEVAKLSEEQNQLLMTLKSIGVEKAIVAPPGMPEDRLRFMRESFDKIMALDGFKAQAKMMWPVLTAPVNGESWTKYVAEAALLPPDNLAKMLAMVEKYLAVK
ncbi:MAG: hypothetical protein HYX91_06490 [Chloroflexi bacterium]|nr:hypothetical protein [Chloroflexota bacterium]